MVKKSLLTNHPMLRDSDSFIARSLRLRRSKPRPERAPTLGAMIPTSHTSPDNRPCHRAPTSPQHRALGDGRFRSPNRTSPDRADEGPGTAAEAEKQPCGKRAAPAPAGQHCPPNRGSHVDRPRRQVSAEASWPAPRSPRQGHPDHDGRVERAKPSVPVRVPGMKAPTRARGAIANSPRRGPRLCAEWKSPPLSREEAVQRAEPHGLACIQADAAAESCL